MFEQLLKDVDIGPTPMSDKLVDDFHHAGDREAPNNRATGLNERWAAAASSESYVRV